MIFPIDDLLDEERRYRLLVETPHPEGPHCPNGHELPADQAPHDLRRDPVMDYRCRECGKVFNAFTGTVLKGKRHRASRLVLILRGFCQGVSTRHLAQELRANRPHLLDFRHGVQGIALERFSPVHSMTASSRSMNCIKTRGRKAKGTLIQRIRRAVEATSSMGMEPTTTIAPRLRSDRSRVW